MAAAVDDRRAWEEMADVSFRKNSSHCGVVELRQRDTTGTQRGWFHAGGDKNTPLRSCLQIVLGCMVCLHCRNS